MIAANKTNSRPNAEEENRPYFSRHEFELSFYRLLNWSDGKKIAERSRIQPKMLNQYLNPTHQRESPLHRAATILCAWIDEDPVRGAEALRTFDNLVKRAFPEADNSPTGTILTAVGKVKRYLADVENAVEEMPDIRLQMREAVARRMAG